MANNTEIDEKMVELCNLVIALAEEIAKADRKIKKAADEVNAAMNSASRDQVGANVKRLNNVWVPYTRIKDAQQTLLRNAMQSLRG